MFEESSGWNLSKFGDLAEDWKYWSPQEALSRQAEAKGCQTALPGGIESAAAEGESILLGATTQKATTTKFNGACNYCGKKGHKAADCWSNLNSPKYKGEGNSFGASGRFKGKCNYCNKMGHKLADCWKKAADDDFVSHLHTTPKHKLQVPNSFPLVQ
mmetsp:Transcript_22831/g.49814  ORF Transcript_22831/g.49814 Transcript_22831/m.49814 type:complete len:158 (+) Transcript_22831:278-751(+)